MCAPVHAGHPPRCVQPALIHVGSVRLSLGAVGADVTQHVGGEKCNRSLLSSSLLTLFGQNVHLNEWLGSPVFWRNKWFLEKSEALSYSRNLLHTNNCSAPLSRIWPSDRTAALLHSFNTIKSERVFMQNNVLLQKHVIFLYLCRGRLLLTETCKTFYRPSSFCSLFHATHHSFSMQQFCKQWDALCRTNYVRTKFLKYFKHRFLGYIPSNFLITAYNSDTSASYRILCHVLVCI